MLTLKILVLKNWRASVSNVSLCLNNVGSSIVGQECVLLQYASEIEAQYVRLRVNNVRLWNNYARLRVLV